MMHCDLRDELASIDVPTLVAVGELDPGTSVEAAREILDGLARGVGRLDILPGCGHFPWLDQPIQYFRRLCSLIEEVAPS